MGKALSGLEKDPRAEERPGGETHEVAPAEFVNGVPPSVVAMDDAVVEKTSAEPDGWLKQGDTVYVVGPGGRHDPNAMPVPIQGVLKTVAGDHRFYLLPAMDGSPHSRIVSHGAVRKAIGP